MGTLIISFESGAGALAHVPSGAGSLDSGNPESYSKYLDKPAPPRVLNQPVEFQNSLGTGKSRRSMKSRPANPDNEAVNCNRRLTGIRPNLSQRELLVAQVTDLPRWKASLEHWQLNGWNPKNLAGQIDLY